MSRREGFKLRAKSAANPLVEHKPPESMIVAELQAQLDDGNQRPGEFFEERHGLPPSVVSKEPAADDPRNERRETDADDGSEVSGDNGPEFVRGERR